MSTPVPLSGWQDCLPSGSMTPLDIAAINNYVRARQWDDGIKRKYPQFAAAYSLRCRADIIYRYNTQHPDMDPFEFLCTMEHMNSPVYFERYEATGERPAFTKDATSVHIMHDGHDVPGSFPLDDDAFYHRLGVPVPVCPVGGHCSVWFRDRCMIETQKGQIVGWDVKVPGRIHPVGDGQ